MPPDNWNGYSSMRRSGAGMPTFASISMAAARAWRRVRPWCKRRTSLICVPTRNTGFSAVMGSWKIIAISLPRMRANSSSGRPARSRPPNSMLPLTTLPGGDGIRPSNASPVTVLPHPDSPTRPSVSPGARSKLTRSTARTTPCSVANSTARSRTRSNGAAALMRPSPCAGRAHPAAHPKTC